MMIGAFLMLTRPIFGTSGSMANSDHLVGALTITVAIIATAEVARAFRFTNVLLGAWLVAAPWASERSECYRVLGECRARACTRRH